MSTSTASRVSLLILVIAISILFLGMIRPFLLAVLLAGIFASLSQPVYGRLKGWFGGREAAASLATLLLIVLVIIVPMGLLLGVVTAEAIKVGESVGPWISHQVNHPDEVMLWLQEQPFYDRIAPYRDDILQRLGQVVDFLSRFLINSVQTATTGTVQFLFMLGVMLYSMFFFLMHGGRLLDLILYYVPLEDDEERRLLDKFRSVTRATLKGTAVIGLLQGGLAGLAFFVVGIPSAIFWGTLMVVLSIIPGVGTALIWVPAAVILIAGGHVAKGIVLAVFCAVVVGSIDNIVRPALVGKDTQMPDLMIFLSTLGGIIMFGALGLILGPIIGALFITVWEMYGVVFRSWLPAGRGHPAAVGADPDAPGDGPDDGESPSPPPAS
jgi:predicted PurR-regulated permease PerM